MKKEPESKRFVFDMEHDRWVWKTVDQAGKVLARCKGSFAYYLECMQDAQANGFRGEAHFINRKGEIFAPPSAQAAGNHRANGNGDLTA